MGDVHRYGRSSYRWIVLHAVLMVVCGGFLCGSGRATEGEDRWRFAENGDQISLYIAATDGGTDDIGSPSFGCKRSSGKIAVEGDMDEQEREAFADLIRKNGYPRIDLIPPDPNHFSFVELSHSDIGGWQYKFDMAADAQAFSNFARTGVFQYKVGEFLIQTEFSVGLENVARFQRACRPSPSR
jgi:hypothetical protein